MKDLVAQVGNLVRSFFHRLKSEKSPTQSNSQQHPNSLADIKHQSVVGTGVVVSGDLSCQDNLCIEGKFKGSIQASKNAVVIGCSGLVDGGIQAKNLLVQGKVIGDISVKETIVIAKTGAITGNLKAAKVELENGAKYKGIMLIDPVEIPTSSSDSSSDKSTSKHLVSESSALEPS